MDPTRQTYARCPTCQILVTYSPDQTPYLDRTCPFHHRHLTPAHRRYREPAHSLGSLQAVAAAFPDFTRSRVH